MKKDSIKKKTDLLTLDKFIDREYGEKGTSKRERFERGYVEYRLSLTINDLQKLDKIIE
jgi:HTH-type transcriptional regulator/antitoxin HipB